jgi:hypothetical protein
VYERHPATLRHKGSVTRARAGPSAPNDAMPRRAVTSIAVALLLALAPSAALADGGAGDNQYQDPLAASPPKKHKKQQTSTAVTTTPAASTAPAAATAPASSSGSPASSRELPRTGAPAGLIGMSGLTLILAGAALRRRTAPQ